MKNKILQTIRTHNLLQEDMHIVIGLSGGPDSVCLFDALDCMAKDMRWKIYAVHVNHKLRPGDAEEDQEYVEALCKERGVPCYVFSGDCKKLAEREKMTSEEAGRKMRYEAFNEVAKRICEDELCGEKEKVAVALAHNSNDQCETILFRILRGSGTDGLAGIAYKRFDEDGFAIVRPILDLSRTEIERYCKERNLSPRIDHTNSENIYTRNKIRNMLIPYIAENFNENIVETVNRLGKIAAEDKAFMGAVAEEAYKLSLSDQKESEVKLGLTHLGETHRAVRFRVYSMALEAIGLEQNVTFAQMEGIDRLIFSESPSAMCNLPDGFYAQREYDSIRFGSKRNEKNMNDMSKAWKLFELEPKAYEEYARKAVSEGKIYGAFSGVKKEELCIRTRKMGDVISIGNGSKKIKDFFVDEKVPKALRNEIYLLAKGSDVLWILPWDEMSENNLGRKGRFSAKYKVIRESKDSIIILEKL